MRQEPGRDISVPDLNNRVRELFQTVYPYPVWVRGTLSGRLQTNQRGHLYFQFVEPSPSGGQPIASLDCVLFAGTRTGVIRDFARMGLLFDPRDGMSARILGRVDLWPQSGRFQFIVEAFDPCSFGSTVEIHLKNLVEKLKEEGLATLNPSLPFPVLPLRIGLVSAPGSAALEDFIATLRESGYPFEVFFHPTPMQGVQTGQSVVKALARLRTIDRLDLVVITRGGGSGTDLSWFDSEPIGRAIAGAPWPVISGIGHEVDFTLPDFIAHTRAKTPTHAASILVDRIADALQQIDADSRMLASAALPRLVWESHRLGSAADKLLAGVSTVSWRARGTIDRNEIWLAAGASRRTGSSRRIVEAAEARVLSRGLPKWMEDRRRNLDRAQSRLLDSGFTGIGISRRKLDAASAVVMAREPSKMLALGWAVASDEEGRLLRSVHDTGPGRGIRVRLADGSLSARTEAIESEDKG